MMIINVAVVNAKYIIAYLYLIFRPENRFVKLLRKLFLAPKEQAEEAILR
jgi:hypothetical protein